MSIMEDNYDRDADQNADLITRTLLVPAGGEPTNDESVTPPMSARAYAPLMNADVDHIKVVASMRDNRETVVTPIGAQVSLGFANHFGENIIDDVAPVPKFGTLLMPCQIPLMVDEQPPVEHDLFKEHDFGRLPTYADYVDSVEGQEKAVEQVLAIPARDFLDKMFALPETWGKPNELNEAVYMALNFIRRGWCEKDTRYIQLLPYIVFYKKVGGKYKIFVYQRGKGVGEERLALGCSIGVGGHINPIDFLSMQMNLGKGAGDQYDRNFTGRMLCEGFWTGILNNVIREGREEIEMRVTSPDTLKLDDLVYVKHETKDIVDLIYEGAQNDMISPEQWLHQRTTFFLDYAAGAVEKVHLAMFIGIEVPENYEIFTNEEELIDVGFKDLDDLRDDGNLPTPLECWSRSIISSLTGTMDFVAAMPGSFQRAQSRFISESLAAAGAHPTEAEYIAVIPAEDRWKIGTLAQIFDPKLKFYAMNAFLRA
jgi:predicted NUDIX family phosphoesterase